MAKNLLTTLDSPTFQFQFFLDILRKGPDHRLGHLDRYFPRFRQPESLDSGWLHGQVQSDISGGLPTSAHLEGFYNGDKLTLLETSAFPALYPQHSYLLELALNDRGMFEGRRITFPEGKDTPTTESKVYNFSLADLQIPEHLDLDIGIRQSSTYWGNMPPRNGIRINFPLFTKIRMDAEQRGIITPYNDIVPELVQSNSDYKLNDDDIPF